MMTAQLTFPANIVSAQKKYNFNIYNLLFTKLAIAASFKLTLHMCSLQ